MNIKRIIILLMTVLFIIIIDNAVYGAEYVCYQNYGNTDYICTFRADPSTEDKVKISKKGLGVNCLNSNKEASRLTCEYIPGGSFNFAIECKAVTFDSWYKKDHKFVGAGTYIKDYDKNSNINQIVYSDSNIEMELLRKDTQSIETNEYLVFKVKIKESTTGNFQFRAEDENGNSVCVIFFLLDDVGEFALGIDKYKSETWNYGGGELRGQGKMVTQRVLANPSQIVNYEAEKLKKIKEAILEFTRNPSNEKIIETYNTEIQNVLNNIEDLINAKENSNNENQAKQEFIDNIEKIEEKVEKKYVAYKSNISVNPGTDRTGSFSSDVITDYDDYKPGGIDTSSKNKVESMAKTVLAVVSNVGIVASVLIMAILGIKYMLGSVEEKADYKQDLIPYFVGAVLLFAITTIVKILQSIGTSINGI